MEAVIRHNLGLVQSRLGREDEAMEEFRVALSIKKELCGESHPETARTHNAMGALHGQRGDKGTALAHFREALRIYREHALESIDDDDPNVSNALRNIKLLENSERKQGGNF
eukprot:CAMPEP_0183316566 /NCGR_PEP_ID=MMETSP0160_2-20130417/55385_1 /TAXON_ID=2839 ORGANISM="Odontella Sinensis, Strain Grunow 1884" /NCGR_SAMPLE_ID=MMETSP0160_2 /ASSEMBLY_ACC=CAM_ASM_000250 /LENGTH=111 /DNA_ID=CAMNT_0025482403 /DNA_START=35 /DNA_END=370 /DNA_ORIENTATION=+